MPAARCLGVVVPAFAAVRGGGGEPPTSFARYAREAWLRVVCHVATARSASFAIDPARARALVPLDQRSERGE
jgi:hypothetical protein